MVSSRQLPLRLSRKPVLQVLGWRLVAERGVATTPVVEDLDVVEQIGPCRRAWVIADERPGAGLGCTSWAMSRHSDRPSSSLAVRLGCAASRFICALEASSASLHLPRR